MSFAIFNVIFQIWILIEHVIAKELSNDLRSWLYKMKQDICFCDNVPMVRSGIVRSVMLFICNLSVIPLPYVISNNI